VCYPSITIELEEIHGSNGTEIYFLYVCTLFLAPLFLSLAFAGPLSHSKEQIEAREQYFADMRMHFEQQV
jgi:hypothetical protein